MSLETRQRYLRQMGAVEQSPGYQGESQLLILNSCYVWHVDHTDLSSGC